MSSLKATLLTLMLTLGPTFLSTPSTTRAQQPSATKVLVLQIQGMLTPNCPVLVKAAVGKLSGVEKVDASLKTKTATVVYRPQATSPAAIRRVIKDQVGFDSTILEGDEG